MVLHNDDIKASISFLFINFLQKGGNASILIYFCTALQHFRYTVPFHRFQEMSRNILSGNKINVDLITFLFSLEKIFLCLQFTISVWKRCFVRVYIILILEYCSITLSSFRNICLKIWFHFSVIRLFILQLIFVLLQILHHYS